MVQGFRQGLLDAGYAEGRDLVFKWQSAHGNYDRLPRLAADLVRGKVDVIVVTDTPSAQAAKRATSTIPVVMAAVADPIGSGLVTSFAHPDANITGITIRPELSGKRLQLLKPFPESRGSRSCGTQLHRGIRRRSWTSGRWRPRWRWN
jgi:putative ABC transport system substrate-binding protein